MDASHSLAALHAVMLGGRAPGCRIELHDVAFAIGTSLESMHEQLLDQWFGNPQGLHIDAYARLDRADGRHLHLIEDIEAGEPEITNGYFPLPLRTIKDWIDRQPDSP